MPSYISNAEEDKLRQQTCAGKIIVIIAVAARMTVLEVLEVLTETTTLGNLGISITRCDQIVRIGVNKSVRIPAGLPPYEPGSITPAKKIRDIVLESCSGG